MAVGLVVVSHSAALADAVAQLARAVSTAELRIALAGGVDDPDHPLGTDASKILAAIESVDGEDGVLVLMDLGSAVLSAELARDLLPEVTRARVLLCEAPLVEGLVAAAVQASAGADLDRVAAEARAGLSAKVAQLGHAPLSSARPDPDPPAVGAGGAGVHVQLVVTGAHGLHARPAARIVEAVAPLDATVTIRNVTTGGGTAPATSLNGLITLGVRTGHTIEVGAAGSDAARAIAALEALAATNFGDPDGEVPGQITTPRAEAASSSPTDAAAVDGDPDEPGVLRGLGAAPGLAVGHVQLLPTDFGGMPTATRAADEQRGAGGDPEAERRRLQRALEGTATDLATTGRALAVRGGAQAAAIVDAHSMLLVDPALLDPAFAAIAEGAQAEEAWGDAVKAVLAAYRALDDPYLAGRAADVDSVGGEVLARLDGRAAADPGPDPTVAGVLVGQDLTPSAAARLDPARVDAVVTAGGAPTSHAAILARALGIPAVVAVGPAALDLIAGTTVIVDGDRGRVMLDPDAGAMA
ncbi:MAG TPA: dihydroxyacetone kinase phosphoryl donor subunit DhaM, partial [Euzebya sp.]|nr:dihydroxyacetone kinase phosphoryl donor subunit DhaM [Euzebya sp.]